MKRLLLVFAAIAVAASAGCGDKSMSTAPVIPPFDSLAQADPTFVLRLFGGSGQWTVNQTVAIHNTTSSARVFELPGGCNPRLQVYANPQGTGAPAWDELEQLFGCKVPLPLV